METKKTISRTKEEVVRGIAVQVFLLSFLTAVTGQFYIAVVLAADFFIRAFIDARYSPAAYISKKFVSGIFRFRKRMIVSKPKKFAAGIGFILSFCASAAGFADMILWVRILTGLLALFSFLEAFLKFCAGCRIFGLLIRLGIVKEEICEDCSFDSGD